MCGRFGLFSDPITLARLFEAEGLPEHHASYNIAPTQDILIVRDEQGQRRFAKARWGLVPHWAKEMTTGFSTINARAETVDSKPAFRDAYRHRRCLIPADGFYEWQAKPGSKIKQPWFITLNDREPMAFAGIWERWKSPKGDELESCSIIVTDANDLIRPIHDRMPVVLSPDVWGAWLKPDVEDLARLKALMMPHPVESMVAWQVSTKVNSTGNDNAECVVPLDTDRN